MAKKYNCEINGKKYFRKRKTVGYDINGKPKIKYFYGDGEKDADRKIDEYFTRINSGLEVGNENLSLEVFMHKWLWDVLYTSKNTKSASFDKHETNYRLYIKNSPIGQLRLYNISSHPIQLYYNDLFVKKELSSKKIYDINKTLRKFFNYCISEHIILDNPCSLTKIQIPGNADGFEDEFENEDNITVFNDEELEIIKNNIQYKNDQDNTLNVAIQLDLVTGLRKGELLGLKRKYINLDKCTIKVVNTLKLVKVFDENKTHKRVLKLTTPKTKSSIREIPFPETLKPILKQYFIEQIEKYKKIGLKFNSESLIFTTSACTPFETSNFSKKWAKFLDSINLVFKKFHSIRDTYATTLIRRGAKIIEVKELLGHSSIKTTERYYIFCFPEDKSKTVNLLCDFII